MVMKRMQEIVDGTSQAFCVEARLRYEIGYPPTINHEEQTAFAVDVANDVSGADRVQGNYGQEMGAEDFSYMLEARPGSYLFLGIGEGAGVHNPHYDFNDEASPYGASFFARLVERANPIV